MGGAGVPGHGGTRPVPGQLDHLRQAVQRGLPVVELPCEQAVGVVLVAEQAALPEGVVGVVDGKVRPLRRAGVDAGAVGGTEVTGEGGQGGAVGGDVVDHEDQDVRGGVQAQQGGPEGQLVLDVDRRGHGGRDPGGQAVLVDGFRGEREADVGRGGDPLVRSAVVLGEDGAQCCVPADDVVEGPAQGFGVQRPVEAQGEGDVVGGGGAFETVEEPEALLRGGQREQGGTLLGHEGRSGGTVRVAQDAGERGDGGVLEEGADLGLGVQRGTDAADEAGGEQGVAAQGEEAVVDPDAFDAQDVGEQPGEDLLVGRAGRAVSRGRRGGGRGQGGPVEFAVGGQGQRVEALDGGGHHVRGQSAADVRGEQVGVRGVPGGGDDVRGQGAVAGQVLADHDARGAYGVVAAEHGLDLGRLDAVAAQLDLLVGPGDVVQGAVGVPAYEVPGAVHAGPGAGERVGDETGGGRAGAPQVAAGDSRSCDVQLSLGAGRNGPQRRVQDVGPRAVQRQADRGHAVRGAGRTRWRVANVVVSVGP